MGEPGRTEQRRHVHLDGEDRSETAARRLLQDGEFTGCEQIPWGSNYTFRVALAGPDASGFAVYKPRRGERPLWDFPEGTLYLREYAAYVAATALGWRFVPLTVIREGPYGIGSLQWFVEAEPLGSLRALDECDDPDLARMAAFDIIANNADRKGGHVLRDADGLLWGIDHGLCFNVDPKVRTVLQRFCGEPLPADVAADLRGFLGDAARRADARARLEALLSAAEVTTFERRIEDLLTAQAYPRLDHYRSVPWPPF